MPKETYHLHRTGVSEQIFDILKEKINSGEWKPGDKITSENELAKQFGVSRMSARNALQRLCAIGMLEARSGEGTFVKEFSLSEYLMNAGAFVNNTLDINDVNEFRTFFEHDYLILACERRTDSDIADLKTIYQKMVQLSSGTNFDAFFETDMNFHRRICEMARNQTFLLVEGFLHEYLLEQLKDNTKQFARLRNASMDCKSDKYVLKILVKEHGDFIDALEQRTPITVTDKLEDFLPVHFL